MSALTDFLIARIDEDERTAGRATPAPWVPVPAGDGSDRWNVAARGAGVARLFVMGEPSRRGRQVRVRRPFVSRPQRTTRLVRG